MARRDAGELREELAEIMTEEFLTNTQFKRARSIVRVLRMRTGLDPEQIWAQAREDATIKGERHV